MESADAISGAALVALLASLAFLPDCLAVITRGFVAIPAFAVTPAVVFLLVLTAGPFSRTVAITLASLSWASLGIALFLRYSSRCPHCNKPLRRSDRMIANFNARPFLVYTASCPWCHWSAESTRYEADPGESDREALEAMARWHPTTLHCLRESIKGSTRGASVPDFLEWWDRRRSSAQEMPPTDLSAQLSLLFEYLAERGVELLSNP